MAILMIQNIITLLTFARISCYTLMGPKLYSQSLPPPTHGWSSIMPYPLRTYQNSVPIHYYGRYVATDPYYNPDVQNANYYITQDNYSPTYSSSFDDAADYYPNVLYYISPSRRVPYYDQSIMDPIDDIQDYDVDSSSQDDYASKSQRDWWLDKMALPNEDINFINNLYSLSEQGTKKPSRPKESKPNLNSWKALRKNRYNGLDGFGRKKEQTYSDSESNSRRDGQQRTWIYGVPVLHRNEDQTVKELKSLLKKPSVNTPSVRNNTYIYENSDLSGWYSGTKKRNLMFPYPFVSNDNINNEQPTSSMKLSVSPVDTYNFYSEGGEENVGQNLNKIYSHPEEQSSVFDTLKKLLAFEDKVNEQIRQKVSKRCPPKTYCNQKSSFTSKFSSTTTKSSSPNTIAQSTTSKPIKSSNKNQKRSPKDHSNTVDLINADETALVRELNKLKHIKS